MVMFPTVLALLSMFGRSSGSPFSTILNKTVKVGCHANIQPFVIDTKYMIEGEDMTRFFLKSTTLPSGELVFAIDTKPNGMPQNYILSISAGGKQEQKSVVQGGASWKSTEIRAEDVNAGLAIQLVYSIDSASNSGGQVTQTCPVQPCTDPGNPCAWSGRSTSQMTLQHVQQVDTREIPMTIKHIRLRWMPY